jgi:hypothetical protein
MGAVGRGGGHHVRGVLDRNRYSILILHPMESPGHCGERTTPRINRRVFMLAAATAAAGVAVVTTETTRRLGLWRGADIGIGALAELERDILRDREVFAREYLRSGEMPGDVEEAARLFIHTELARHLREHPGEEEVDGEEFMRRVYRPFMEGVRSHFERRQEEIDPVHSDNTDTAMFGTPSVALMVNAKEALQDRIGGGFYWRRKNNIVDALTNAEFQCRSGSRLLLLTFLETVYGRLQEGERLIVVYSNHHMQTGLLTADGRVVVFDMTKSAKGIQYLGPMREIKKPVMVLDAAHDLAQAGINRSAHPDQTILYDNVPENFTSLDQIFDKSGAFGGGGIRQPRFRYGIGGEVSSTTDQYGFGDGSIEIPDERIPITPMDYIPSDAWDGAEGFAGNGIYDTLHDPAGGDAGSSLYERMTPRQRADVAAFEQHGTVLLRHYDAINDAYRGVQRAETEAAKSEAVQRMAQAIERCRSYIERNGIGVQYDKYRVAVDAIPQAEGTVRYSQKDPRKFLREAGDAMPYFVTPLRSTSDL